MADVRIERDFRVSAERLYKVMTEQSEVISWWGHDGMEIPSYALDLSRPGPWHSKMIGSEGARYKMSGQVTHVNPPRSVGFTWAWHDEDDKRGNESHVTFNIESTETGARLTIDHRNLPSDDAAANHERGWITSPMLRLDRHLASLTG